MSEAERVELGERIRRQRERAFGTKRAAYQAADVNGGTWDRAEAGEVIRGDRLRSIVRTLWPDTEGDWTAIDSSPRRGVDERVAELEAKYAALEERFAAFFGQQLRSPKKDENPGNPGVSA